MEKEVERKLKLGVEKLGGKAYKFVSPGNAGVPDRLVLFPAGKLWFVELKTKTGRLSGLQKNQIRKLALMGYRLRVLYGEEDVAEFLEEVRRDLKDGA